MSWGGYIPGSLLRKWKEQGVLEEKLDTLQNALYSSTTSEGQSIETEEVEEDES
jgi:hypothetical protein